MVSGLFVLVSLNSSINNIFCLLRYYLLPVHETPIHGVCGLCDDVFGTYVCHQHPTSQTSILCSELPYMLLTWFTWLVKIHLLFASFQIPMLCVSHVCGSHLMVVQCLPPAPQSLALLDCSIYRVECDVFVFASSSSISMKVWVGSNCQQV